MFILLFFVNIIDNLFIVILGLLVVFIVIMFLFLGYFLGVCESFNGLVSK